VELLVNQMCGIAGIVDFSGSLAESGRVRQMVDQIRHRGPDSSGVHAWPRAVLGHARLSIIDLSDAGHQPMLTNHGDRQGGFELQCSMCSYVTKDPTRSDRII
jgi:asparagine synthetase B (glutamine-hydrolysing)